MRNWFYERCNSVAELDEAAEVIGSTLPQGRMIPDLIDRLTGRAGAITDAQALWRIGLANYFAGALILPYRSFLQTAEAIGYDIDLIAARFDVGFETTCHPRPAMRTLDLQPDAFATDTGLGLALTVLNTGDTIAS